MVVVKRKQVHPTNHDLILAISQYDFLSAEILRIRLDSLILWNTKIAKKSHKPGKSQCISDALPSLSDHKEPNTCLQSQFYLENSKTCRGLDSAQQITLVHESILNSLIPVSML